DAPMLDFDGMPGGPGTKQEATSSGRRSIQNLQRPPAAGDSVGSRRSPLRKAHSRAVFDAAREGHAAAPLESLAHPEGQRQQSFIAGNGAEALARWRFDGARCTALRDDRLNFGPRCLYPRALGFSYGLDFQSWQKPLSRRSP